MMRRILSILFFITSLSSFSQIIYKGLSYGMTEKYAAKEYNVNKSLYKKIDLGNGFVYRTFQKDFHYDNGKLVGLTLKPKGMGGVVGYNTAVNYLNYTRSFFENLGYTTFLDNEYWNKPHHHYSSGIKWGLIFENKEKQIIIQLYPSKVINQNNYIVMLTIWNRTAWLSYYNSENEKQENIINQTGF